MVCLKARLFDEPQLASLCLENIDKNTGDALAAEGFTDIDIGTVSRKQIHGIPHYRTAAQTLTALDQG